MTTNEIVKVQRNPLKATVARVGKDGRSARVVVMRIVENKLYGKRDLLHEPGLANHQCNGDLRAEPAFRSAKCPLHRGHRARRAERRP